MRILHTADWHLGDRLGRIDRTEDLRRAVERVARYCDQKQIDVLLVAGDIFSELSRPESLRGSIEHLQQTFEPFLQRGGTILAVTGNHDNEVFCQTLQLVMALAMPAASRSDKVQPPGRLYLATDPNLLRLADGQGTQVQFLLMPYPTPARYLKDAQAQRFTSLQERNQLLQSAYTTSLHELLDCPQFDRSIPAVLAAHIHVQGSTLPQLFRMTEQESIVFSETDVPAELAYVALGHIHQAQTLRGLSHVRYASSIERLDLGERNDQKGVVLVDIGPEGRRGEPEFLPLEATPIYAITFDNPADDLPRLRQQYPQAQCDLVNLEFTYTAGKNNLEAILKQLDDIFPRWYARNWRESTELGSPINAEPVQARSFEVTVRDYLHGELMNHAEDERQAILNMAEELMTLKNPVVS
jgi:exonuclease SbcD